MTRYTIHVERIAPPIPVQSHDWCATLDGYEPGDPIGYGATPGEAVDDLLVEQEQDVLRRVTP